MFVDDRMLNAQRVQQTLKEDIARMFRLMRMSLLLKVTKKEREARKVKRYGSETTSLSCVKPSA